MDHLVHPSTRLRSVLVLAGLALALLTPAPSRAAVASGAVVPHAAAAATASAAAGGSVTLDQAGYTAHESQGYEAITIQRTGDLNVAEHVGYGVKQQDAQSGVDFDAIDNRYVTLAPGQSSYTFNVHIIDQGMNAPPVHALAYLYGAWPAGLGANINSPVTILHDDALDPRDAANPLGLGGAAGVGGVGGTAGSANLIAGTRFYVDPSAAPAQAVQAYRSSRPSWATLLATIADEPGAHRFYMWNLSGDIAGQVAHYLQATQVQQPGTTVMLSTYSLVHDHCGYTATAAMRARYDDFINQVAAGIGNFHVVFFLELDSLITAPCLDAGQLAIRDAELRDAIGALEADPHVVVYLDGGAADAAPPAAQARFLRDAGVSGAQGFFLNSTHFDWTTNEIRYGQAISRRLGGARFIVNTGENGRGPLRPRDVVHHGNEVLCNPPGRGLGPLSLTAAVAQPTSYAGLDGLLWFSNPGGSGGPCRPGAPPTGAYWPAYGVMLARNWVDRVSGPAAFSLLASPFQR